MKNIITIALSVLFSITAYAKDSNNHKVKLYALDCGNIEISDLSAFADDGSLNGKHRTSMVGCYLIRHPKGDLMWDTGISSAWSKEPDGVKFSVFHNKVKTTLSEQLTDLTLKPSDIDYLSISHAHFDHVGNANLFSASTFIANELEHNHMFSKETKAKKHVFGDYSALEHAKTVLFKDDYDVFSDGSVVIKSTPGHTDGHTVLQINLDNAGTILLTGDLYTSAKARELGTVPTFNKDKAQTIKSRAYFEAIAKKENARVIIQHSVKDFKSLPAFPEFLD